MESEPGEELVVLSAFCNSYKSKGLSVKSAVAAASSMESCQSSDKFYRVALVSFGSFSFCSQYATLCGNQVC